MSSETKVAVGAVLARVGALGHHGGHIDLGEVAVEDEVAIELHLDGGANDGDLFEVPFADGALVTAERSHHAVGGTVNLAWVEFATYLVVIVVEHLDFTHADIGRIAFSRVADAEAVIAADRNLNFGANGEVGEVILMVEVAALLGLTENRTINHFVLGDGAAPVGQVLAVEDGFEALVAMSGQDFVRFFAADFADGDVAPLNLSTVGLQADRAFGGDGGFTIVVVFEDGVVDGLLAVEPDADAGADHEDAHRVPFARCLVGENERVFTRSPLAVIPKATGTELGVVFDFLRIGGIPDLDLRAGAEVNAGVAEGGHVIFEDKFDVAVILVGGGVGARPWIDELAVLHGPVLREFVAHLLQDGVLLLAGLLADGMRIVAMPAREVFAVKQRREARGGGIRLGGGAAREDSSQSGQEEET